MGTARSANGTRMRAAALGAVASCAAAAACSRSAVWAESDPDAPDPDPADAAPPRDPVPVAPEPVPTDPAPPPKLDPSDSFLLGACAYECVGGCSRPGVVVATRLDTGAQVIPVGVTPEESLTLPGGTCRALVPADVALHVEAWIEPGFDFVEWAETPTNELHWSPCPCEGSTDPICDFIVTDRVYCGARYRRR